jgi:D-alanyl-D-alanine carboxypeptidase/D-alanyl-D-alanine-endopeptidase (penicillin-binding protein 4)
MLLAIAGFLLAGCAGKNSPQSYVARVDTVFKACPVKICPPLRCPPPMDPRLLRVGRDVDTAMWVALDSLAEADYLAGGGVLGAMVIRTRDSQLVWSRQPDTRMLPASTQKLFSVGAALSELGPGFRWRTTLWAQGRIQGRVLHGNLLLEGGGDPTLGGADGLGLTGIAYQLSKLGVQEVRGNLVAIDTLVGRGLEAWPQGWTINSARDGYGAPVLGLNWAQNRIWDKSIPEPRPEALKALRKALAARNISVTGTDTTVQVRGDSLATRRDWSRVGSVASPPLDEVARICLRESVNPYADAMVLAMGMGKARVAPRDAGRKRMQEWAARKGLEPWRMVLDDGSGLSRYDLVTARQMAKLLTADLRGPKGDRLVDFMARGGEGTMRRRFKELPDPSRVTAKTGTLDGVANLAGVLARPGRDTLAFAFLCSGYTGSARPVRKLHDRMIALLAGVPLRPLVPSDTAADTVSVRDSVKADWVDSLKSKAPVIGDSAKDTTKNVRTMEADTARIRISPPASPTPSRSLPVPTGPLPSDLDSIRRHWSNLPKTDSLSPMDSARILLRRPAGSVRDTGWIAPGS